MAVDPRRTLGQLASALASGEIRSQTLVTECLERIKAPDGEGARTFLKVYSARALETARYYDDLRSRGATVGPYAGIPVSVKDLFDVAGDTTTAGSELLRDAPAAREDCVAVARLRGAGFIVLGRTNMTEFAYSGLGLNPHYGTPLNPWDRSSRRIPGGSSSGAAVCISDGMSFGALGTDTGGSCRIPAALCGVVGYKPTARRVPLAGTYPLSTTLDSIGPLANSVGCCQALDAVLAGETASNPAASGLGVGSPARRPKLGVLTSYVIAGMDSAVSASYEHALQKIAVAGAQLQDLVVGELETFPELNKKGGISAAEAFATHRDQISRHGARYDPRVLQRILRGREQDAADYIDLLRQRSVFIERVASQLRQFDAVLMPTVPIIAPTLSEVAADADYVRLNALVLRNPSIVNFLDGCAISIPCQAPGEPPVGLTLFALAGADRRLFEVATIVESILALAP